MNRPRDLDSNLERLERFGVRLGLETTYSLLEGCGSPQLAYPVVLVAGTNGKGSTAALLESMARASGYRVGLYTSPHLESVEERIRVDGLGIARSDLADVVARTVDISDRLLGYPPTYFEALTAAAFDHFARVKVDLAVVEVGLGGRLDATNASEPVLSLVTEIGLEHQTFLGDSLAAIAREKAGILRPGAPAVGWLEHPEARAAVRQRADSIGADLTIGSETAAIAQTGAFSVNGQDLAPSAGGVSTTKLGSGGACS
ncbi:MAG: Mur ligase family protein [Acidobacteriota bacterium]